LADNRMCAKGKNLFAELRPFHFQQFDLPTIQRVLARYGFAPKMLGDINVRGDSEVFGIATLTNEPVACPRMSPAELKVRLDMYLRWRDESILSLPKDRAEALYGTELKTIWKRAVANGALGWHESDRFNGLRRFREAHLDDDQLEFANAPNYRRMRFARVLAGRMLGPRRAERLEYVLQRKRLAKWLKMRASRVVRSIETRVSGLARRSAGG
jgi:hypothetical protein